MRPAVRRLLILLIAALAAAAVWGLFDGGRYLEHDDPLAHADAIFVLAGTEFQRPLEAVDLFKAGYAPTIALSPGNEDPANAVVRSRGIALPRGIETVRDVLVRLGVPPGALIVGPGSMDNTAQEGLLLKTLAAQHRWHTVIVVTSKYHTRRSAFAFRRGLENTGAEPIMRASRYDTSDPARWWRRRADLRFAGSEWFKLIYYRLGG